MKTPARSIVWAVLLLVSIAAEAQTQAQIDSSALRTQLHNKGTFEGHVRTFTMATVNRREYPDYYAWAIGAGLSYRTPVLYNFQVGLSGFIIHNITSSNLGPANGFSNRYEIGLFDINDPKNHSDLDRLEDLYVRYYLKKDLKSFVQLGKFHLITPLINLQDGRMRPNMQEGIWMQWTSSKSLQWKAGWLWRTSPRSTIHWSSIGQSIGIYPMGRAVNGARADYAGNVNTRGVAIFNVGSEVARNLNVQLWNYYVPSLFHVLLPKAEWTHKQGTTAFGLSLQYFHERSLLRDTVAVEQQYISRDEQSHAVSARLSVGRPAEHCDWSLNFTRVTAHGRFLFPREWGIEPFYTFMNRERIEGAGDVSALMVQNSRTFGKARQLTFQSAFGLFWMPASGNAALNKYAMSDFYQLNFRAKYKFSGLLDGLQADFMYVFKGNMDKDLEVNAPNFHNKVDMHHLSLVIDYYF